MKMLKKSDLVFTLLVHYLAEHNATLFWFGECNSNGRDRDSYETAFPEHYERYSVLQDVLMAYGYTLHELLVIENCDYSSLSDYVK